MTPNPFDDPQFDTLSAEELAKVARAAVDRCMAKSDELRKQLEDAHFPLDPLVSTGSIVGGAVAGHVMGSIQGKIDAGVTGYTEENLSLMGVDLDVVMAGGATAVAYVLYKIAGSLERQNPGSGAWVRAAAKTVGGAAFGAAGGLAYRVAHVAAAENAAAAAKLAQQKQPPEIQGADTQTNGTATNGAQTA